MIQDPKTLALVQRGFRSLNKWMLLQWRLGLGPLMNAWPEGLGAYMVIVHTGRKTGVKRFTPVNYAEVKGELYCTAGFGSGSQWYRNILATPSVELWLPNGRWLATAQDVTGTQGAVEKLRQVLINSGFVAPLIGLQPQEMSDDALAAATADYRLIHFQRTQPAEGPGGPGDLAWVWPVAMIALLPMVMLWWRGRRPSA